MIDLTSIKLADPEVYEGLEKELKRQKVVDAFGTN